MDLPGVESEEAVLGAILTNGGCYKEAALHLVETDFYSEPHRLLWRAMTALDEDGKETLGGIWDYRDDPEGMSYGLADEENEERLEAFRAKQRHINQELKKKLEHRKLLFDGLVEQIPKKE